LSVLDDVGPAAWVEASLADGTGTVSAMVPAGFPAYVRVLPPTYVDGDPECRHRWPEIAAAVGVPLTAGTRFDDLVAGSDGWGRPSDGGLDRRETAALAGVLAGFTGTPERAYFCLWEGFGLPETDALAARPARVRTPHRAYHLLAGPVSAAATLPAEVPWRCASLWWPADRTWLVATELDGYLTYAGGTSEAVAAILSTPALDAVPVTPETPLDPSYG
jgi:hypothetical protein